jgi:hypothetical protein
MFKVTSILALAEEDSHTFSHVDSHKSVKVADHGSYTGKGNSLCDSMLPQVFPAEGSNLHVELDYEGTIKSLEAS